jgi:hypothetical protein
MEKLKIIASVIREGFPLPGRFILFGAILAYGGIFILSNIASSTEKNVVVWQSICDVQGDVYLDGETFTQNLVCGSNQVKLQIAEMILSVRHANATLVCMRTKKVRSGDENISCKVA